MWLIEVFIIALIALCAAQVSVTDVSTTSSSLPTTTLLPMSSITPTLSVDPPAGHIYAGEKAVLSCSAKGSSPDWTYLWFHNDHGTALPSTDPSSTSYTIDPAALAHSGKYWCRIKRAEQLSAFSDATSFVVIDPPKPSLELQTQWLDVFPTERVELSCGVQDSSDWTYTWYRDGTDLQADNTVSLGPEGSTLTIPSATKTHSGNYFCRGQHKSKPVTTSNSNSLPLQVYANKPQPTMTQTPSFDKMYVGELVSFTCRIDDSSGWEYLWYRDGAEIQTTGNYTIKSPQPSNSGQYWCQAKRGKGPFYTEKSEMKTLQFSDPPKPSLELQTQWLDVFPTERVELSCGVQDSSDWTYTWYRDGTDLQADNTVSLGPEGSTLTIPSATKTHSGNYFCRGQHKSKPVTTSNSNSLPLQVYANKPQPTMTQTPSFDKMYVGELVSFTCRIDDSSGWEYLWYRDGAEIQTTGNYTIKSPQPSNSGHYWCRAKRGKGPFYTEKSEMKTLQFSAPPKPSLKQKTEWLDVFPTERVELICGVQGSSDWTYTWFRDGTDLQADNTVSLGPEGSTLTIPSATQTHEGLYTCKGHHKTRKISSEDSQTADVRVHGNTPTPSLSKDPGFKEMFAGETVTFSCKVSISSGWEYLWYKDGRQLPTSDTTKTSYTIRSPASSDGGTYKCKAKRGKEAFHTKDSDTLALHIIDIPVSSLELETQWLDVFPTERVEFSCGVQGSSDWTYTWYRNEQKLRAEGSSLTIVSAKQEYTGRYTCKGQHKSRPVKTESSKTLILIVYPNKPKPLITQDPNVEKMYIGEAVSFGCRVDVSSGWEYLWYKNRTQQPNTGNVIASATTSNSGTYQCMAKRGKTIFNTEYSEVRTLRITEIPVPSLELQTQWLDVFPTEGVELSCGVQDSSDWTYTWYRDGQMIPEEQTGSDGATLSIHSASKRHSGTYICGGLHKTRRVRTKRTSRLTLKVYDEMPKPMLTREPEFKVMYIGESVLLSCEVNVSSGWEFQWNKDGKQLLTSDSKYSITSAVHINTGEYQCQAKRGKKSVLRTDFTKVLILNIQVLPWAVVTLLTGWSEVFSTDSLALRCDVQGSQDLWNYTWFREGEEIHMAHSDRHTVTPQNDPSQNQYICRGVRTFRPLHSTLSEPFKTKNLLLKRRVLLSISGCLFFGIIAIFIGCLVLRVTRKPAERTSEMEEPNMFLTMAELKARNDAPIPLAEYITEAALTASTKDADENGTICSESTPLCISSQADQAVTSESIGTADSNGGLMSFKQ